MDPDKPVQFAKVCVKFANAEEVAADEVCVCGPYARASRFSLSLMNLANPDIYASPLPRGIFERWPTSVRNQIGQQR